MKKLLVRWLVICSFALCASIASAADNNELESSLDSCQGAFQVNGDVVTIKPLNSTICADDKFALLIYQTFPVAAEFIGGVFNLENNDLLVSKALEMSEEVDYTVPLESVEASSVEIVGVFFKIAVTMFVLHLLVKGFNAMQSGDSGDVIRYVAGASICALLTTSLSLGGRINPKGETTIASLPLVGLTFAGIGFANTVKSSSIYLMSQAGLERELINGVEIAPPEQQAYAEVKELIEEAMCLDSVALGEIYLAADNERMAARRSILRGAILEELSFDSDGTTSRFEYNPESNTINSGWRLSDDEHRKVCASRTLTAPSTNIDDDLKSYIDDVASKVDVLNPSTEKMTVAWDQVESQLDDDAEISEYLSAAQYLYSRVLWRLGGGDVAVNEGSRALFNNRSSIGADMAREIRAGECFADYVSYKNTEMTIKGMNSGSVGGSEWTLDCAIVRNGQLEMLFEGDTSDAASFAHKGLEAMSEHKYKAVELHAQLLGSFEAEEMVRSALRSVEARIQVEHAITESKDEEFNRRAIMARTQGLLSFGNNAVRMLESWVDVSGALLKTEASVSSITSSVTKYSFYAGERGYLPSNVDLEFPERVMPSFIYYVPFQAENNAAVTEMVESQLGSQLDGGQGATASFMQKNSGLMYEEAGAPSTTTQTELLDESASSITDDMTTVALEINSSAGLSAGEVRRRAAEMCKTTATQSQIDELGISTGEYNALCARNSIMALTYYKNLGFKSVDHAASLAVVGAVSMGANKLVKIGGKKKDKGLANDGKISETASNPSLLSSVLPASGKAAAKINSMVAGLANASFIQYIAGTLITLTLGLVVVTTVIYLLPSLLFTFAMTGLVSFTLIACAVSGVMACGWIIFGGDFRHLRKAIVGTCINLVIRPMMLVIALFLSVAIVQVADMMVTSIGTSMLGNVSANLDFASSMMFRLVVAIVNLVFLLWLLRSSIIEVNRATDKLIELAGGSRTGDDSERALNVAVIASSSTITHQAQGVVNNATNKQR